MFNIRRYDPQPVASTSQSDGLAELTKKIEERRRKRTAGQAGLSPSTVPSVPTPAPTKSVVEDFGGWQPAPGESPAEREKRLKREKRAALLGAVGAAPSASVAAAATPVTNVGEWQPAPGESPAEREKRLKREKRAARFGVSFDLTPAPPSGSTYVSAPPLSSEPQEPSAAGSIHPSRLAAAPKLAKEARVGVPKDKTPAKKKYLKKKKERAKSKRAGEPLSKVKGEKKAKLDQSAGTEDGDDDNDDEAIDGEEKRQEILRKKAERKAKRDEKKAELRRLKAEGADLPAPTPRVVPPKLTPSTAAPTPTLEPPEPERTAANPTAEELEVEAEEAARLARKEAKRLKRMSRRLSPSLLVQPSQDPPLSGDPSEINFEADAESERSLTPVIAPSTEPVPLIRLPGATRPAPPSAKTLSVLKVHESVRSKIVVDPEKKLSVSDASMGISERGRKRLENMGIETAFAVQTEVIPILLPPGERPFLYSPFLPPQDVCVSAPTGSGKTLSYVVPIVETLSGRVVTRLRAVVLLPTRDLVAQVRETFEAFGKGTGLKIGTATGQHSFAHEKSTLVGETISSGIQGGSSQVDILIATPGRLMDHLRSTPGFSLQHLRFLVIDEADRLLNQSFHEWLPTILAALRPTPFASLEGAGPAGDALAPAWWDSGIGRVASDVDERSSPSCQKLLFSATLSRDPAKIAALHLHRPIFVSVEDRLDGNFDDEQVDDELKFTLPSTLQEFMIISPSSHKPLYLLHLLHTLSLSSALCFTKSVEAASRLAKLVEFFEDERKSEPKIIVKTYSSDLAPGERTKILASFKKGEIQMLICSDLIARGIDLPDVSHVISYDIPTDMRKYVHRVGRTARAGRTGDAWSLVEDQEAAPFKAIMRQAQHWAQIKRVRVKDAAVEPFVPHYEAALERLQAHFATSKGPVA